MLNLVSNRRRVALRQMMFHLKAGSLRLAVDAAGKMVRRNRVVCARRGVAADLTPRGGMNGEPLGIRTSGRQTDKRVELGGHLRLSESRIDGKREQTRRGVAEVDQRMMAVDRAEIALFGKPLRVEAVATGEGEQ